jgi:hypothetical protein
VESFFYHHHHHHHLYKYNESLLEMEPIEAVQSAALINIGYLSIRFKSGTDGFVRD